MPTSARSSSADEHLSFTSLPNPSSFCNGTRTAPIIHTASTAHNRRHFGSCQVQNGFSQTDIFQLHEDWAMHRHGNRRPYEQQDQQGDQGDQGDQELANQCQTRLVKQYKADADNGLSSLVTTSSQTIKRINAKTMGKMTRNKAVAPKAMIKAKIRSTLATDATALTIYNRRQSHKCQSGKQRKLTEAYVQRQQQKESMQQDQRQYKRKQHTLKKVALDGFKNFSISQVRLVITKQGRFKQDQAELASFTKINKLGFTRQPLLRVARDDVFTKNNNMAETVCNNLKSTIALAPRSTTVGIPESLQKRETRAHVSAPAVPHDALLETKTTKSFESPNLYVFEDSTKGDEKLTIFAAFSTNQFVLSKVPFPSNVEECQLENCSISENEIQQPKAGTSDGALEKIYGKPATPNIGPVDYSDDTNNGDPATDVDFNDEAELVPANSPLLCSSVHSPIPPGFFNQKEYENKYLLTPPILSSSQKRFDLEPEASILIKKLKSLGPNVVKSIRNAQLNKGTLFNQEADLGFSVYGYGVKTNNDSIMMGLFDSQYLPRWRCNEEILLRAKIPTISEYLLWIKEEALEKEEEQKPCFQMQSKETEGFFKKNKSRSTLGEIKRRKEQKNELLGKRFKNQEFKVMVVAKPKGQVEKDDANISKNAKILDCLEYSWFEYLTEKEVQREVKLDSKANYGQYKNIQVKLEATLNYKNNSLIRSIRRLIQQRLVGVKLNGSNSISNYCFSISKIYIISDGTLKIKNDTVTMQKTLKGIMKKPKVTFKPSHYPTSICSESKSATLGDEVKFNKTKYGFFTNCYCDSCNEAYRKNYMEPYQEVITIKQGKNRKRCSMTGSPQVDFYKCSSFLLGPVDIRGTYLNNNSARILEFTYYNKMYFKTPSPPEPRFA